MLLGRKNHAQRDQEQDDAAGDADGLVIEVQQPQQVVAEQQQDDQDAVCQQQLANQHLLSPRGATCFRIDRKTGMFPSGSMIRKSVTTAENMSMLTTG